MAGFTEIATNLISQAGYAGLGLGLVASNIGIPMPSEVLIPLATILALQGRFNSWAVFFVSIAAQLIGSSLAYAIGRYGGEPLLEKYGKYVLISKRDIQRSSTYFERYGHWLVLIGYWVPGVRGFIAYPAGIARMRLLMFLLFSAIAAVIWTAALMYVGLAFEHNLGLIDSLAKQFSIVGIILVLALLAWHFRHLLPGRKSHRD